VPDTSAYSRIPFADFLKYLRRNHFQIGLDHYERLYRLIERCPDASPIELRTLLCPIFATSRDSQQAFYEAFDSFYPSFRDPDFEPQAPIPAPAPGPAAPGVLAKRWPYLLSAGLVLLTLVLVLTPLVHWRAPNIPAAKPTQPLPSAGAELPRGKGPEQSRPSVLESVPVAQEKPATVFARPWWLPLYDRYRIAAGWTALLGPGIIWLFYEIYRSTRRRITLRREKCSGPPYAWPLRASPGALDSLYDPARVAAIARRLQTRRPVDVRRIDIEATVQASVAGFGYPRVRYRSDTRLPEYLLLIDRRSARDHLASWFEQLGVRLRQHGVFVATYFFDADPRTVWPEATSGAQPRALDIQDLQGTHAGNRLLVVTDGDYLLDSRSGRLHPWVKVFQGWRERALLTPRMLSQFGRTERILSRQFVVEPATLEGLENGWEQFQSGGGSEQSAVPGLRGGRTAAEEVDGVPELRRSLGPAAFELLCACAVYGELHWSLTAKLASVLDTALQDTDVLKLFALTWFREGAIPDALRLQLIRQLTPAKDQMVRRSIVDLLTGNPAPANSFAAIRHEFEIVLQQYATDPRNREARKRLRHALWARKSTEFRRDAVRARLAEEATARPIDLILPRSVRQTLYPGAIPGLGVRTPLRATIAVLATVGLMSGLKWIDKIRVKPTQVPQQIAVENPKTEVPMRISIPTEPVVISSQPKDPVNPSKLELKVSAVADRTSARVPFQVSWNPAAVQNARDGVLSADIEQLRLNLATLRRGGVVMTAASAARVFTLVVHDEAGRWMNGETVLMTRPFVQPPAKKQSPSPVTRAEQLPEVAVPSGSATEDPSLLTRLGVVPSGPPPQPETSKSVVQDRPADRSRRFAVVIGIGRYQQMNLQPLRYAADDARLMASYLQSSARFDVTALGDDSASLFRVMNALEQMLVRDSGPPDDTLIFFSGYAVRSKPKGESYFLTYDSLPEKLESTALPVSTLRNLALQSRARNIFLLIDAHGPSSTDAVSDLARDFRTIPAVRILAASDGSRTALQMPGLGMHGLFTSYLIDGLSKTSTGVESFSDLTRYLTDQLQRQGVTVRTSRR
jgi:hypothetical protein